MNKNNFKNVIVFSFLGLGDFVWATSAISLIKQYDKDIKVTLISFDTFYKLANKSIGIDDSILINYKLFNNKYKFVRYIYKFCWFIKNFFRLYKKETIIFLDISKGLSFCSKYIYKIKNIIGPNNYQFGQNIENKSSKYYTQVIQMPIDCDRIHMAIRYQLIIRKIFPTQNLSLPQIIDTSYLSNNVNKFLQETKKYKIALCLRGAFSRKSWNIDNVKNLITKINEQYKDTTFYIIGNTILQNNDAKCLQKEFSNIDIRNLVNKTNLLELIEFLKNIDLLISVDTGITHLSATLNVASILLYGPGLPEHAMALSHKAKSLCSYRDCSPCDKNSFYGKGCYNPKCLQDISVDMIFDKVKEILK